MNTALVLKLAALAHLGLICAGIMMPRVVGLAQHLRGLPKIVRQLFWVYYTFIGLCLISFGVGTFVLAEELASGTVLARAVCGFMALFWTLRLLVGTFVFDLRPYLTDSWRRIGLFAANLAFAVLPVIYGWVALK